MNKGDKDKSPVEAHEWVAGEEGEEYYQCDEQKVYDNQYNINRYGESLASSVM